MAMDQHLKPQHVFPSAATFVSDVHSSGTSHTLGWTGHQIKYGDPQQQKVVTMQYSLMEQQQQKQWVLTLLMQLLRRRTRKCCVRDSCVVCCCFVLLCWAHKRRRPNWLHHIVYNMIAYSYNMLKNMVAKKQENKNNTNTTINNKKPCTVVRHNNYNVTVNTPPACLPYNVGSYNLCKPDIHIQSYTQRQEQVHTALVDEVQQGCNMVAEPEHPGNPEPLPLRMLHSTRQHQETNFGADCTNDRVDNTHHWVENTNDGAESPKHNMVKKTTSGITNTEFDGHNLVANTQMPFRPFKVKVQNSRTDTNSVEKHLQKPRQDCRKSPVSSRPLSVIVEDQKPLSKHRRQDDLSADRQLGVTLDENSPSKHRRKNR